MENNEFLCTFINTVDIRRVTIIIILYDVLFTVHHTIIENKMIFHFMLFTIPVREISVSKDLYLRFLPTQQLPERHLEEGRGHRGPADRGGDQDETEAAAEPVLPEHRPTQGEPAAC